MSASETTLDPRVFLDALPQSIFEVPSAPVARSAERVVVSDELSAVSRRIAGQYVEVLAGFARQAFAGTLQTEDLSRFRRTLEALNRLAGAVRDRNQEEVIQEALRLLDAQDARLGQGKGRSRFSYALQSWIPRFAATLDPEDRDHLLELVTAEGRDLPLLQELGRIPGIGPRRLARLYCAGLYTVDAVSHADPVELTQVTGLPLRLSTEVVSATRRFAAEHPKRCLNEIRTRLRELQRMSLDAGEGDSTLHLVEELMRDLNALASEIAVARGRHP